uniref:Uncharacterized protein n=1 Tax=Heterorhabditis bacteriophora TaxID=37862 RepID=A0A1I7WVQ9_HETBA
MGKTASNASAPKKETNRRKVVFRDEAMGAAALLGDDITFDNAWVIYKLDCFDCTLHDVHNPKSVNCRDNPYCIKRLGLEKFEKLIKAEKANSAKVEEVNAVLSLVCNLSFHYFNILIIFGDLFERSFFKVWYNEPVFRQIIFDWRPSADYIRLEDYRCDVCNEQGKVKRQTISEKLPPVLMLQLNRYVFDA